MGSIEIREITDVLDVMKIEDVQRDTWGMTDREILPGRFLHAMQHNGACLYGAFDGSKVVGFVFGVLGTLEGLDNLIDRVAAARLQMYSAIMGVLPEYQSMGIGYRLKKAQREFALRIGVRLVTWTYDPLESRNAHFNINKLGVVCNQYKRDFHGEMSGINMGLPTDRLYVSWWVTSNRVKTRLTAKRGHLTLEAYLNGNANIVNKAKFDKNGFPTPPAEIIDSDSRIVLVEIPDNIQALKTRNMDLALAWRFHTRDLFEKLFRSKYLVTGFLRHTEQEGYARSFYALTRTEDEDLDRLV